jgi:hypothetical protein
MSKLRSLNIRIEYTGSIIRTFEDGRLGNFLKILAREHEVADLEGKNCS